MQQDFLKTIEFIYNSDNIPALLLDNSYTILWRSRHPMPFDITDDISGILGLPESSALTSGDYSYILDGFIFTFHVIALPDGNFLISLSDISQQEKDLNSFHTRRELTESLNSSMAEISCIAGSASELNDLFESGEDIDDIWDDGCSQLNNIMCRCTSVMKRYHIKKELLSYFEKNAKGDSTINIGVFLEKFAESVRLIAGPRSNMSITVNAESNLFADVSENRMEILMLCLIDVTRGNPYIPCTTDILTFRDEQGKVVISFTISYDNPPEYQSDAQKPDVNMQAQRLVIKLFSQRHCRSFSDITTANKRAVRIEMEPSKNLPHFELKTPPKNQGEAIITPYHAFLSDKTNFRYY